MSIASRLCSSTLAIGLLAAPAAQAEVTAEQAAALQKQLHDWVAGVVGPSVAVPALPLQFIPEGDHYRLQIDVPGVIADSGVTIEGGPWTASARQLEGNRWAIDNMKLPSPLKFINATGPKELQGSITMTVAEQENHSIFDPTLATTSSSDGKLRGLSQTVDSKAGKQTTNVAQMSWHQSMQPKDGGRQNLVVESTMEGYVTSQPGGDMPIEVSIDRLRVAGHVDQMDFERMGTALRASLTLGKMSTDASRKPDAKPTPAERDAAQLLIRAMGELIASADGDQTMEGLRVKVAGLTGRVAKMSMGGGFGAPKGETELHLRFGIDGIESADIPAPMRDFVPRHVSFAPKISGIAKADIMALLTAAVDSAGGDSSKLAGQAMAVLDKSPVTMAIEDIVLDIGLAKLTGSAELEVSSPTDVSGEAEIRMTGFDALQKKVSTTDATKMGAPVLIFLKGIAERDGKELVWNVKYEDNKVTINGTDLSDMIPQGGQGPTKRKGSK